MLNRFKISSNHLLFYLSIPSLQNTSTEKSRPRSKIPKHSASLQNTYFHLNVDCARRKNPQFEFRDILIHNEIKHNLSPEHKLLLDSLGIQH
jgi:hypothetical protein